MNPSVIIVDDEPFMLRLVEASLKKGGFETKCFRDAETAIAHAENEPPSIFIMDLMMPAMNGIQALREIKLSAKLAAIPVVMLTSKGHHLDQQVAQESGAAKFITKPFSPTALLNAVRELTAGGIS